MLAPVSGNDLSVDNVLLLVFTLRFIRGVGDPGMSSYEKDIETEVVPFVEVWIIGKMSVLRGTLVRTLRVELGEEQ